MAITTTEELKTRCLGLVARGDKPFPGMVATIVQELKEGGSTLTVQECSYALRDAYVDGFITEKYLRDLLQKEGVEYD